MKYFTPKLYRRLQDCASDEAMNAADAAWQDAVERYDRFLDRVEKLLPPGLRKLTTQYYLHDSEILSLGVIDSSFVIVLRLEPPPRHLLILNYRLTRKPTINKKALAPSVVDAHGAQWMYEEVGAVGKSKKEWTHSILLSNGWEITLRLRDVTVHQALAVFPEGGMSKQTVLPKKTA